MDMGKNLKMVREIVGLSQSELAKLIGVEPSQISHMETGVRGIGKKSLEKLAHGFGLPERELLRMLQSEGDDRILTLWNCLFKLPKENSAEVVDVFLAIIDCQRMARAGEIPEEFYQNIKRMIQDHVSLAQKMKK